MVTFLSLIHTRLLLFFFFFNDTATTEIYTLSLHDALPIYRCRYSSGPEVLADHGGSGTAVTQLTDPDLGIAVIGDERSEEHTSELQSRPHLVCRLLLEKKKKKRNS